VSVPAHGRALRAVSDLLLRSCAAGGLIIGLLWALQRPTPATSAACEQASAERIGECMGQTLAATMLPFIIAMGVGMIVGALIGVLVSRLLLGRTRQRGGASVARGRSAASRSPTPARPGNGRWITARYDGHCRGCGSEICAGDNILHRPGHALCAGCGVMQPAGRARRGPSPRRA